MLPILASWLVLAAVGAAALALLARSRRLASVPVEWRVVAERLRRRLREIDAQIEIVEWIDDPAGGGALIIDRDGARTELPLAQLRDAPPELFEERLLVLLAARAPGLFADARPR
jgi:hypothetical protein